MDDAEQLVDVPPSQRSVESKLSEIEIEAGCKRAPRLRLGRGLGLDTVAVELLEGRHDRRTAAVGMVLDLDAVGGGPVRNGVVGRSLRDTCGTREGRMVRRRCPSDRCSGRGGISGRGRGRRRGGIIEHIGHGGDSRSIVVVAVEVDSAGPSDESGRCAGSRRRNADG